MITESGIYDIPNSEYHSQECTDGVSISSTGLRTIRSQSPAHFWAYSDMNPKRLEREVNEALDFGKIAHSWLLEGQLPKDEYVVAPFSGNYSTNEEGWRAGEKREWRDLQQANGLTIVTNEQIETILGMREALEAHELVKNGLLQGQVEQSVFYKDPKNGIYRKVRPDVIPADSILVDYKSAISANPETLSRDIASRGYHTQLAMCADVIEKVTGRKIDAAALLVQEKTPPYVVSLYPLSDTAMDAGHFEYMEAYKVFCECVERGEWPGYKDSDSIGLPGWHMKRLQDEGLLPPEERNAA